ERTLNDLDRMQQGISVTRVQFWLIAVFVVAFYVVAIHLAAVDLGKLATGLPKLWRWIEQAWPPKLDEVPLFLLRTAETVAMAAIGTTIATLLRSEERRVGREG